MDVSKIIAYFMVHTDMLFYLTGLGGMLTHYVKKWTRGETKATLIQYLFEDSPKSTLAAVITFFATATAAISVGSLHGMDMYTIAALGFTTGFSIDSAVNKANT